MLADFFDIAELQKRRAQAGKPYFEFLRVPALSAGVYALPAGVQKDLFVLGAELACASRPRSTRSAKAALFSWQQAYNTTSTRLRKN